MKKNVFLVPQFLILLVPLFVSCCNDDSQERLLGVNGNIIYLWCGESRSIDVLSGSVAEVVSSDQSKITASYESGKIVLTAHRVGEAVVTCRFSDGEVAVLKCKGCILEDTWYENNDLVKTYSLIDVDVEASDKAKEWIFTNLYWDIPHLTGSASIAFNNGEAIVTPAPGLNYSVSMIYRWDIEKQQLTIIDNGVEHDYSCEIVDLSSHGYPHFVLAIHIDMTDLYQKSFPRQVEKVILTRYLVSQDYVWTITSKGYRMQISSSL